MQDISPQIVELFDRTASKPVDTTDRLISRRRYLRGELFREAVASRLPAGAAVLDYGCGRGRIARMIAAAGYRVDAMDPSAESLKDAQRQDLAGLSIRFSVLTGFGDALETAAYDGIVCSSVIEFVEDTPTLLDNLWRALKPDGMLFVSFANRLSLWRAYAKCRFGRTGRHFAVQRNVWSPSECCGALRRARFVDIRVERYFEPPSVKVPILSRALSCRFVGTLGLVSARRSLFLPQRSENGVGGQ